MRRPSPSYRVRYSSFMRGDQITRVLRLMHLLQGRGRTLEQLRAELGVTRRTVQRDIAVLERAGFAVVSEPRARAMAWRLMGDAFSSGPIDLTLQERMALYFSRGMMKPLAGTPLASSIESALAKVGAGIPAAGHALLHGFDQQVTISSFGTKDFSRSGQVIATLSRAIHHHFTVKIEHATPRHSNAVEHTVDPYRLWYTQGGLYLVALDRAAEETRTFAVERIRNAKETKRRFTPPLAATLDELQASAFQVITGEPQLVRIRFSPQQAPYIAERIWHESQTIEPQSDGGLILLLRVASLWEVKRWLYGWGADAELLESDTNPKHISRLEKEKQ